MFNDDHSLHGCELQRNDNHSYVVPTIEKMNPYVF